MIQVHQACEDAILQAAKQMCNAAQTAPKACGKDDIVSAVLTREDLPALSAEMRRIEAKVPGVTPIFVRDADLVDQSVAVVLIGVRHQPRGLHPCNLCGQGGCGKAAHCAYDDMDLGIALGSAVSLAADLRVDNRIMYSVGMAAMNLKLLGEDVGTIMGIPLAVSPRSIYFTRTVTVPAGGCK